MLDASEPVETSCRNCGAELHGNYCHECGQKASSTHVTVSHFLHDAVHEFLHLDGKILRTLKLLVLKPGMLTNEFLAGRRVSYITPLRLYLTFSVIFFALAAIVPAATKDVVRINTTADPKTEADADKLGKAVMKNLPRAMFVLMPAFGLLTWAFYRRQQTYYVPHLYYSVHVHAFVFLMLSLYALLVLARGPGKYIGAVLLWSTVPYHFIALRRVFGGSRGATFTKGMAIGIVYWMLVLIVILALAASVLLKI